MPNFRLEYAAQPAIKGNDAVEAIARFVFEGEWSSDLLVGTPQAGFSNKSDGWIIQKIVMRGTDYDAEGDSLGEKVTDQYWEVWRVDDGAVYIPADGSLAKSPSRGDTFAIVSKEINAKHRQTSEGWAVFVHDADDDYDFVADRGNWQTNCGAAKDLPSRKAFKEWDTIHASRLRVQRTVLYHKLEATFEKKKVVAGSLVFEPA